MHRYNRHITLPEIGLEGQQKLIQSKVLVIGAGGLGCPILQYLTAAGVGSIGIIDFDVVDILNLQRQVLYGSSSLGQNKALAAKKRLEDLNSDVNITAYPEALTHQNAINLFKNYDIIVDGSDNFETRYLVNDACIITNKPLVFGAIYKFEGQVSVFNYQNGPSYRCLFPNPPQKNSIPNCSEIGVLGVLAGVIGCLQANEVLKIILGIGDTLSGKLLLYNALSLQNTIINIQQSEEEIKKVLDSKDNFKTRETSNFCDTKIQNISIEDALNMSNIQFIDVREKYEQPKIEGIKVTQIPLSDLENQLHQLETEKDLVLFCQSGIRSKKAVSVLKDFKINNCYYLNEGAYDIIQYLKTINIKELRLK